MNSYQKAKKFMFIITNNAGEQIKGTMRFDNPIEAFAYVEGMRFAGYTDCYVNVLTH